MFIVIHHQGRAIISTGLPKSNGRCLVRGVRRTWGRPSRLHDPWPLIDHASGRVTRSIPGLDCRRCGTDTGRFCSVKVGWTTRGSRRSDLTDLVDGRRGPEHQHISELQLTSALSGSRRADLNLEPTNEFQISLGLGLKCPSIPLPALSISTELRLPCRRARAHGPRRQGWRRVDINCLTSVLNKLANFGCATIRSRLSCQTRQLWMCNYPQSLSQS